MTEKFINSSFNGKVYRIPKEKMDELESYIASVRNPSMDEGMATEMGRERIPTPLRALSFTGFLREWYENKFKEYLQPKGGSQ